MEYETIVKMEHRTETIENQSVIGAALEAADRVTTLDMVVAVRAVGEVYVDVVDINNVREEGEWDDEFIVIRDGVVSNIPELPIFDMDILKEDNPNAVSLLLMYEHAISKNSTKWIAAEMMQAKDWKYLRGDVPEHLLERFDAMLDENNV